MPSRTPRGLLQKASKGQRIGDDARQFVEAAYGRRLPDHVWEQIKATTSRFVSAGLFAPTLRELRHRLETLSRAASYFEMPFPDRQPPPTTLKQLHRQLLKELRVLGLETATTMRYLQALARSCRILADYSIDDPDCLAALSQDERWDIWISDLTGIVRRGGLAVGVRKDSDKNVGQISPFVRLVAALQDFIPASRRRFIHSLDGLASGIARGRQNWKRMEAELLAGQEQGSD